MSETTRFARRRALLKAGLVLCGSAAAASLVPLAARARREPGAFRFEGEAMGTSYRVTFVAPRGEERLREAARSAVDAAIADVDARMSTFKPASEISRLNRHGADRPFAVSEPTLAVLLAAHRVSTMSAGAFDVTAGPLVNAWGFGPRAQPRIPGASELRALRQQVGFGMLALEANAQRVRKAHAAMYVDLSGVAKGYGVDRAAQALERFGIVDYVVEMGGEVRAHGRTLEGRPWRIGIEEPQAAPRRIRRVAPLSNLALATSGDYRIYFERGGRRYCHEIDPASASPVRHALTSVTVGAADCATADALSTALIVLGPDAGFAFAERHGLPAYFVERAPHGALVDRATAAFARLGQAPPRPRRLTAA